MAKVIVFPPTSMILSDLVDRSGHKALVVPEAVRTLATDNDIQSPPLNVTPEEPKKGLRYAAVDVPSGVRGRMALIGPLIEEAEAAIIVNLEDTYSATKSLPDLYAYSSISGNWVGRGLMFQGFGTSLYFRISRDGANNLSWYWSSDGLAWTLVFTLQQTISVTHAGLSMHTNSSGKAEGYCDWIRANV